MTLPNVRIARELDPGLWREFLHNNPRASIFHTPEMFEVFTRAKGHEPGLWVALDPDDCPIALFTPVKIALLGRPAGSLVSRAVAFGGVVCAGDATGRAALDLVLRAYEQTRSASVLFTELRNTAPVDCLLPTLDTHGYQHEGHLNFLIDLTQSETALWGHIRSNARRNIRKAESMGVIIDEVTDPDCFGPAYDVLRVVYKRLQVPLPDISLFVSALKVLHPAGMIRVFTARVDDQPIGALTLLIHQGVMTYWYTGTLREFSAHRPADLLVWHALKLGAASGCRVFDFGGGGRPDEEYGVRDFKAKFGGELVDLGRNTCVHAPLRLRIAVAGYELSRHFI